MRFDGKIVKCTVTVIPGDDEPVVWYEGATLTTRRFLHADERGSVIAVSNATGTSIATNKYDEYGIPMGAATATTADDNVGRFQYTGQAWIPEIGLYYYKARFYSPSLGRFMQTDPIGYKDGINWYNYVDSDPINRTDPTGLCGFATPACIEFGKQVVIVGGRWLAKEAAKIFVAEVSKPNPPTPPQTIPGADEVITGAPPRTGEPGKTVVGPDKGVTYGEDGMPVRESHKPHNERGPGGDEHVHDVGRNADGQRVNGPPRPHKKGDPPRPWRPRPPKPSPPKPPKK